MHEWWCGLRVWLHCLPLSFHSHNTIWHLYFEKPLPTLNNYSMEFVAATAGAKGSGISHHLFTFSKFRVLLTPPYNLTHSRILVERVIWNAPEHMKREDSYLFKKCVQLSERCLCSVVWKSKHPLRMGRASVTRREGDIWSWWFKPNAAPWWLLLPQLKLVY